MMSNFIYIYFYVLFINLILFTKVFVVKLLIKLNIFQFSYILIILSYTCWRNDIFAFSYSSYFCTLFFETLCFLSVFRIVYLFCPIYILLLQKRKITKYNNTIKQVICSYINKIESILKNDKINFYYKSVWYYMVKWFHYVILYVFIVYTDV